MGVVSAKEFETIKSKQMQDKRGVMPPSIPTAERSVVPNKKWMLWHPDRSERSILSASYAVLDTYVIIVDGACLVYREDVKNELVKHGFKLMREEQYDG